MRQRKVLPRLVAVVVFVVVAGGIGVAFLSNHAASPESASSTDSFGYGAVQANAAGLSSGSPAPTPTTQVLGTLATTTIAASTSTESTSGANGQQSSLNAAQASVNASASGHAIEFFGSITLQVSNPAASLQQASAIAGSLGGYVGSTSYTSAANNSATVTLMIPAAKFESAMTQLQQLGVVQNLQSSSNDVTVQYTDLNASLASLLTEQASLLKLLNQSSSVNSTIQIESILEQTDVQINEVESQIIQTAQLVDYATLTVDLETATKAPAPLPLEMKVSATPRTGLSPLSVTFDAVVTGGTGPYVVNYNFGDGTSSQGQQLIHTFVRSGTYNVTVSATDQSGNVTLASVIVTVTSPPGPSGLQAFGATVFGLLSSVVEGIVEVAVVVLPVFFVAYLAVVPAYRRFSKSRTSDASSEGDEKKEK